MSFLTDNLKPRNLLIVVISLLTVTTIWYSNANYYQPSVQTITQQYITNTIANLDEDLHEQLLTEITTMGYVDLFPEPFVLANIPNFTYVLNRDICKKDPVDLLILVGSHPVHRDMRKVLREIWGGPREDEYVIKLMFPIGRPNDPVLQQKMIDESAAFGDIVQGRFEDDYTSVSIRDLMSFHWTWTQCPQARFVMHIDDDTSVDLDYLLAALEKQMPKDKDYMACFAHFIGGEVLRTGRYGLSKEEHPADVYDHYCSGWAYWFTPRTAKYLDKAAVRHMPYRMNDAYLTGTLMTDLGWHHQTLNIAWTMNPNDLLNYLNSPDNTAPTYLIGPNAMNETFTRLLHQRFHKYYTDNKITRNKRIRLIHH